MSTWTYSLKFSLRSLLREVVRNSWGRTFVYPRLAANERSAATLRDYVARRAARIGVPLAGDGTSLPRLASATGSAGKLLTKAEVRQHPEKLVGQHGSRALRGVMTSSETLEPDVRASVEQAFGVRVFDWYGQAERVAAIGTCEHGSYHVLTDYGDAALLAPDGAPDGGANAGANA